MESYDFYMMNSVLVEILSLQCTCPVLVVV